MSAPGPSPRAAAIGSGLSNYTITYANASTGLTVAQKALGIFGLSATNKGYDSTTADPITGTGSASLIGKVPGDTVILGTGTGTAAFADPNVGTGKTVTFSGYSISGADAANYSLSQPASSTANITAAGLTITASNQSETYGFGGTSVALGTTAFTASGLFGSDSVTSVTLTTNATLSSSSNYNAGTWNITPSAAIGSGLSNYTITYDENSTGLTVAAKALTVTALNQSRAYGVADPSFTGSITEFVSITGFVNGDFLDSSKLTGFPTLTPTDTGPSSLVGKYTIKCFQPDPKDLQDPQNLSYSDTNYTLASFQPGTLTITPVPLTITANNQNEPYGFGGTSTALGTTAFTYSGQLLILLCQLGRYPLWHAHEFTQQQLLGRFEPEPVTDLAMDLRQ